MTPKKLSLIITTGPTREKIDPVRFISNYSTGTFGSELAGEARRRGLAVTLISGPTTLGSPRGVKFIRVETALDMKKAVSREFGKADCLIMAAAVSDWRVRSAPKRKMKRGKGAFCLELVENPDIIAGLGRRKKGKIVVGFALETENVEKNALKKLVEKRLDMIVANKLGPGQDPFGANVIKELYIIDKWGNKDKIYNKSKKEAAKIILDKVLAFNI